MPKQLRKSDIVRLVQFASWNDVESLTLQQAEAAVNDFLERMGAAVEDEVDQELDELGLL